MSTRPAPGIAIEVATAGTRVPIARTRVAELAAAVLAAERVGAARVSITFLGADAMGKLNWRHLRHRGPTDVITFALTAIPGAPLTGDVYICPEVVRGHARAHGRPVREEIARVVVHAMLHVLGHVHPEDDGRTESPMWRRQERLLARLAPTVLARAAGPSARSAGRVSPHVPPRAARAR